jgi:hypothetical protein
MSRHDKCNSRIFFADKKSISEVGKLPPLGAESDTGRMYSDRSLGFPTSNVSIYTLIISFLKKILSVCSFSRQERLN